MREKRFFVISCLLSVFLLMCNLAISAQTTKVTVTVKDNSYRVVRGKVTDIEGHSLPGVNVRVKDVQGGTVCDIDGNFALSAPREDVIFVFSYIGMVTQEVLVKGNLKYNPQIQISAESGTKRSIFRQKNKTKRSKKRLHTTLIKPEQKVNEDFCSGFIVS